MSEFDVEKAFEWVQSAVRYRRERDALEAKLKAARLERDFERELLIKERAETARLRNELDALSSRIVEDGLARGSAMAEINYRLCAVLMWTWASHPPPTIEQILRAVRHLCERMSIHVTEQEIEAVVAGDRITEQELKKRLR